MIYCPEDDSELEEVIDFSQPEGNKYQCPRCDGILTKHSLDRDIHLSGYSDFGSTSRSNPITGRYYRCPIDKDLLLEERDIMFCQMCQSVWQPGKKVKKTTKNQAQSVATQTVGLLVLGISLFAWQLGAFNSSADPVTETAVAPLKITVILVWFVTFSLLFLVPTTVYYQMVQAHRPHLTRSLHHPLVRWLPLLVITMMAANIYFLTP